MYALQRRLFASSFALTLVCLFTACAAPKVALDGQVVPLQAANVMPDSKTLRLNHTPRITVFTLEDAHAAVAQEAALGTTMQQELIAYLQETGARIVDSGLLQDLAEQLRANPALQPETSALSPSSTQALADYAISGTIRTARIHSSLQELYVWRDKQGKIHRNPARCRFEARVAGTLNIYSLQPTLQLVDSLNIDEPYTRSEETRAGFCHLTNFEKRTLLNRAASAAIQDVHSQIQNRFAPKAYVLEARQHNGDLIFKLSHGAASGFKPGDVLAIYSIELITDDAGGKVRRKEVEIVRGEISSNIGPDFAWIVVNDQAAAQQVRQGDFVKVRYGSGFFERLIDRF